VTSLLAGAPERAKREFQRLAVWLTVSPVVESGKKPFFRAVGTTDFSKLLAGSGTDFTATVASDPRSDGSRTRFVVDLPPNQLGPAGAGKPARPSP
jgi:hypothetical protein